VLGALVPGGLRVACKERNRRTAGNFVGTSRNSKGAAGRSGDIMMLVQLGCGFAPWAIGVGSPEAAWRSGDLCSRTGPVGPYLSGLVRKGLRPSQQDVVGGCALNPVQFQMTGVGTVLILRWQHLAPNQRIDPQSTAVVLGSLVPSSMACRTRPRSRSPPPW
jgi:hypothetical protein